MVSFTQKLFDSAIHSVRQVSKATSPFVLLWGRCTHGRCWYLVSTSVGGGTYCITYLGGHDLILKLLSSSGCWDGGEGWPLISRRFFPDYLFRGKFWTKRPFFRSILLPLDLMFGGGRPLPPSIFVVDTRCSELSCIYLEGLVCREQITIRESYPYKLASNPLPPR